MMRKIVGFFMLALFVSCSNKNSLPDTILPVQKMAEVMVDVNIMEASLNLNVYGNDTITNKRTDPSVDILTKHNITLKQYQDNFEYYTKHLDSLAKIYELVLIDLSKRQAVLTGATPSDSVKSATDTLNQ